MFTDLHTHMHKNTREHNHSHTLNKKQHIHHINEQSKRKIVL